MAVPDINIRHITGGWHDLGVALGSDLLRVCEHWIEFTPPEVEIDGEQHYSSSPVMLRSGMTSTAPPSPITDPPLRLRSFIGLVIESGGVQLQVKGRVLLDGARLKIEVEPVAP